MSEYEPVDMAQDTRRLINEVREVGTVAGTYVSRSSHEFGNEDARTKAFDRVAQTIQVALLEFEYRLRAIELDLELDDLLPESLTEVLVGEP